MAGRFLGCSVTGTSHIDSNIPCQDAWQVKKTAMGLVACVSDGAGSAQYSHLGSQQLIDKVCAAFQAENSIGENAITSLKTAIKETRECIAQQGDISDYHATLCGVATSHEGSLVFHIGDGVIIGINPEDWSDFIVSEPENGEFAETTYFFTLPDWQSHLRLMCAPKRYKLWFLMSDGAASFAALTNPYRPTTNFLLPVHRYLASIDETTGQHALESTLNDPRTNSITNDDKTLVWFLDE